MISRTRGRRSSYCLLSSLLISVLRSKAAEYASSFQPRVHLAYSNCHSGPLPCFASTHVVSPNKKRFDVITKVDILSPSVDKLLPNTRLLASSQPDEQNNPDEQDNFQPPNRNTNFLAFLTTYIIVPFMTCSILNIENENYQFAKQQFNAASSGFDSQISLPGSAEYIAMSNLYNESMQALFVLLLSKRLALYFIATVATVYAGWRSYEGINAIKNGRIGGTGEALDRLNSEILEGEPFFDYARPIQNETSQDDGRNMFSNMIDQNEESSDVGKNVAMFLPLALSASLALSYGAVVAGRASQNALATSGGGVLNDVQSWVSTNLPLLLALPGFILCLLFVSAEFRRVFPSKLSPVELDSSPRSEPLLCPGNTLALFYVLGAYLAKTYPTITLNEATIPISLDLWPLQNGVNIALATTVVRALGPFLVQSSNNSIRTTALALIGVAIFDGVSVFGTVANAASYDDGASVMEVVARSKLASQSSNMAVPWKPGLLEIIVGHNSNQVSEALGLGDVVFPACLIAWALNADADNFKAVEGNDTSLSDYQYTIAATFGYVFASLVVEVVGSFSLLGNRAGLPALVFLVPIMLICVAAVSWRRGELQEVWGK